MKFDNIVGNPPFNLDDTTREEHNYRGQGDNIAKKFIDKAILLGRNRIFLIAPYARVFSSTYAKKLKSAGLFKVSKVNNFPDIHLKIACFCFDKTQKHEDTIDEFNLSHLLPKKPLKRNFFCQPGKLNRVEYEDELISEGKYKIVVTTNNIQYTNNLALVNKMADRSRGKWRVVLNTTAPSYSNIGTVIVVGPEATLSKSVNCFVVENNEQANILRDRLMEPFVKELMAEVKSSKSNSLKFLQYIPDPLSEK